MSKKFLFSVLAAALTFGVLTGCGKHEKAEVGGPAKKSDAAPPKAPPPLDMGRIAEDEKWGIKFSSDKKTLVKYNSRLELTIYTLPDGVKTIGKGAFRDSKNLETVVVAYGAETIGDEAFAGCENLKDISIPSTVTTIGGGAFAWCKSLTSVTIPSSVTTIGEGAFSRCGSVKAAPDNPVFYNDAAGALIDRKRKMLLHLPAGFTGAYTIPEGVTTIGKMAFMYCSNLTSVTIPEGVTTIGISAFAWCCNLTSVTIPSGVTTIGKGAFAWCQRLTSVTIPSSVTTIGPRAFVGCTSLTSVTIPFSVTTIGENAFVSCPCEESVKKQFPKYNK